MYASCLFHESILVVSYNNRMNAPTTFVLLMGGSPLCVFFSSPSLSHMYRHRHASLCVTLHTGRLSSFCPFPSTRPFAQIVF